MKEITVDAVMEELTKVTAFVDQKLKEAGCSVRTQTQVDIAVDEIFSNIVRYAYGTGGGKAAVCVDAETEPRTITLTFTDRGVPYNPLEQEEPDISLSAEEREPGGLGIFMVKNLMDEVGYRYENGHNVLCLKKFF